MKIYIISDTHFVERAQNLTVPNVDLIIHCGDEATSPYRDINNNESREFFDWYSNLAVTNKIFVPGNHSLAVYYGMVKQEDYPDVKFLIDEPYELNGIKFYGSPWTPTFGSDRWVYNRARGKLDEVWKNIPNDTNVLITHGPAQGFLDLTSDIEGNGRQKIQVGCKSLSNNILNRLHRLKLHCFGHIHQEKGCYNSGILQACGKTFVNASVCNLQYKLINNGYVIEI